MSEKRVTPGTRSEGKNINGGTGMKCLDCVCGIETEDGIWCVRFKGVPSKDMANKCQNFLPRGICESHSSESNGDGI